jgi:hypothetical protein
MIAEATVRSTGSQSGAERNHGARVNMLMPGPRIMDAVEGARIGCKEGQSLLHATGVHDIFSGRGQVDWQGLLP